MDPDAIEWDLNEWDDFSLEAALQLREAEGEGEVVVISVGDEEAEEGLRACLAKGADRAVRIWDDSLEDADAAGGGARARGRRGARVTRPRAVRRAVERRREQRHRDRSGGASRPAARGRGQGHRLRRFGGLGDGRARARGRASSRSCGCACPRCSRSRPASTSPATRMLRAIKQAKEKPLEVTAPADLGLDAEAVAARRARACGR